jgi:signal transduction histidine kinase/HAMP domain-containing protein/ActR/RegA family two-component response regulator
MIRTNGNGHTQRATKRKTSPHDDELRGILEVLEAVKRGDFTARVEVSAGSGTTQQIAREVNELIDRLQGVGSEIIRVAREVGTEGKLGAQAEVRGMSGTWKDLTDNVNGLAANLTNQVRNIALVTTAVANGDLSQKITVEARGEILELKNTINRMVDQLRSFASEVTRVARDVGTEGKLGAIAEVQGVAGTWRDLTHNVNALAGNLTNQVRNIALVTTAVANGDLSQKITVEARGEILELKETVNRMVDQLRSFASEVTRVAREVGTDGKLGGQAQVPGVAGTWKDLTDNVNQLAGNLTNQVRNIALVTTAVARGDLSQKITVEARGEILELKETINRMVDQLRTFSAEVTRVAREVGTDGKLGGQALVPGVSGTWKDLTENVNQLAGSLTNQVRNIAVVTKAIQAGDLSQKITVEARGEILELKDTVNRMVDQLRAFAAEVTRVAREVGTDGKLGGQAMVPDVAGTWKDLTENVNVMASNLTSQVRGIAKVVTAVAQGDLRQKLALEAKGEIASLADTINDMTNTLRVFADQVTTVAREVGIDGQLGGQAKVPGASGTWRDLTDAVNQLASNLTTQVRAIAEVATAVTAGDLTRAISVEAQGEVLQLKDNINMMIANLRDTTRANWEQDWLKTNLAKFTGMMQGQRSIASLARLVMSELTPLVSAQQGLLYVLENEDEAPVLQLLSSYAFESRKQLSNRFSLGEGLVGQCALEKKTILVTDVPGEYLSIRSGLGRASPTNVIVLPVLFEGSLKAVIELATFQDFTPIHITFLEQLVQSIGVVFNMIGASMRTEELLQELQRSNSELGNRSRELEEKASELEIKNREIARASASLEEKARELARASKYKSDFLANMSHELRTPLNSLLILAKLLADNEEATLTSQQVEYARTICSSGHDLLSLINEILDLSKVEAGKVEVKPQDMLLSDLREFVSRSFEKVAEQKSLGFQIHMAKETPSLIHTDPLRLQQILKNLLSNAFKFTNNGQVTLSIQPVAPETVFQSETLQAADEIISFAVIDTGIGIPEDKQRIVFEAFHQADASTSRTYGGTGLGLAISRELARLLGGEITLESEAGHGSTFTLFLPVRMLAPSSPLSLRRSDREIPVSRKSPQTALAGRKVLVVDDDVRNAYAIRSLLERRGMNVLLAEGARASLDALQKNPDVDLVLMDIMMPEIDGYDATRNIRAMESFKKLPIIALTSKAMVGDREKVLEAGCTDFVPKPVDNDQLLAVMNRLLTGGVERKK